MEKTKSTRKPRGKKSVEQAHSVPAQEVEKVIEQVKPVEQPAAVDPNQPTDKEVKQIAISMKLGLSSFRIGNILDYLVNNLSNPQICKLVNWVISHTNHAAVNANSSKEDLHTAKGAYLAVVRTTAKYLNEDNKFCYAKQVGTKLYQFLPIESESTLCKLFVEDTFLNILNRVKPLRVTSTGYYIQEGKTYKESTLSNEEVSKLKQEREDTQKTKRLEKATQSALDSLLKQGYHIFDPSTDVLSVVSEQDKTKFLSYCITFLKSRGYKVEKVKTSTRKEA